MKQSNKKLDALKDQGNRSLLRVYTLYRFALAGLILAMHHSGIANDILGSYRPELFSYTAIGYAVINTLTLIFFIRPSVTPNTAQIFFLVLVDICAITLLMHTSNGIQSGLGFLLLVCVAAGSLFISGQLALLLAAVASICVISTSIVRLLGEDSSNNTVFQAGLLGVLLFVTALAFQLLTRRLRRAQIDAESKAQRAAQLQQLNKHIIARMRTGIIVLDSDSHIQLINDAAKRLLGDEANQENLSQGSSLTSVPTLQNTYQHWREYPWIRPEVFQENNAGIEVQANFTYLTEGEEQQILIFLEDTRTLSQHAQLIKQESLSRLTGSIAHEIRNPLGAISHAAQLLEEDPQLGQQSRLMQIIKKQSDRVNQIIENVLQLSRQQPPKLQKLDIKAWLNDFIEDYRATHADQIVIDLNIEDHCQIQFDPSQLNQVVSNLLDNALRYSNEHNNCHWAGITLSTSQSTGRPYLDIEDKGPGVLPENTDKIFEPFFTTSHQGSGLGLYICRELCELNFATLNYHPRNGENGFFRIGFAHPDRLLPGQMQ
ncbi:ATP-binding protein [Porticoccaceae bacterium LTM1]|nr:ATP-binding protein [Porticoccaceae bacterium LTM1]